MRIAVCPGTFDPMTVGHLDVIERAAALFDQVVVAVGTNPAKQPLFALPQRLELVRQAVRDIPGVVAEPFDGLLATWCAQRGATAIVKGLRSGLDWDAEEPQALLNEHLGGPPTVFVPASPAVRAISSTLVRQIASLGGDVTGLVPDAVTEALRAR